MQIQNQLVVGTWQEPDNLNAYFTWTASGVWFGMLALESVVRPDDYGGYLPTLLEQVPLRSNGDVSPDGTQITYRLKRNVRWADNMPFSSSDLKFTWEALSDPVNDVINREGLKHVQRVETPDESTAILHLDRPYAAYPMFYMAVFPKHLFGKKTNMNNVDFNYTPSGTGPYYVENWVRGDVTMYRRNPFYRGPGPYFEHVLIRYFRTQRDLVNALLEKKIDFAVNLDIYQLPSLQKRHDLRIMHRPSTHIDRITYNLRDPLLQNVCIRQAIDLAIDRDELIREAFNYLVEEGTSELDGTHWTTPFPRRHFDLDRAKLLLNDAGWLLGNDGVRTKDDTRLVLTIMTTEGDTMREQAIQVITSMLSKVGIELHVRFYPTQQFFAMVSGQGPLTEGNFQLALCCSGMFSDPEPNYSEQFHSDLIPNAENNQGGGNWGSYHNSLVDHLLDQASETLDQEKRKTLYAEIEQIVHDDCPVSYLYKRPIIDVCRSDLLGVQHLPYFSVWSQTWSVNEWRLAD